MSSANHGDVEKSSSNISYLVVTNNMSYLIALYFYDIVSGQDIIVKNSDTRV